MKQVFEITAFRNIGFKDGKPCASQLVLGNSTEHGRMGELLVLVGANNAGKSNVLDALETYGKNTSELVKLLELMEAQQVGSLPGISPYDVNSFFQDPECKLPKLTIPATAFYMYKDFGYSSNLPLVHSYHVTRSGIELELKRCYDKYHSRDLIDSFILAVDREFRQNNVDCSDGRDFLNFILDYDCDNYLLNLIKDNCIEDLTKTIVRYKQKHISNTDFALKFGLDPFGYSMNPEISAFFERLFNAIKVSPQEAVDAYKNFRHFQDKKYLVEFQEMVNDKLQSVSDIFNRMYFLEDVPFSFKVEVERIGIFLTIHRGKVPVRLEQQSTGFRYFFDMFFNLLCTTELKPGTILIMDEPATNLHVKGQRELRAFLKEFALLNDITIIVATHSPFLVDLDNLDELRVVVGNNDGTSRIVNDFTAVDPTDPDTLRPIKEALTVENYMLVNPKETVVFVSSLAEYNLLVAFKKLLRKEGISFLPFNLDGADQQSCMEASKGLQKIRSDAFVIVPDDEAGQLMKSLNDTDTEGNGRSDLEVIFWNEIDPAFGTVNSLLSQADQNQLFPEGIDSSSTSVFKNHILEYEAQISEETRENLQKLFHRFD